MNRAAFKTSLMQMAMGMLSALAIACQPLGLGMQAPVPASAGQSARVQPKMVLDPATRAAVKERLSGASVIDYSRSLLSSPTRWGSGAAAKYKVKAFGQPDIAAWTGGVNLQAAPFNLTGDFATNGFAFRVNPHYTTRVFLLTRNGKFLGLDPANPTVGYSLTNLGDTFTKTSVVLAGDGSVAFCVADSGKLYAINVANTNATTPLSHSVRSITLSGACKGVAPFIDPVPPFSNPNDCWSTMYVVDNTGSSHKVTFGAGPSGFIEFMTPSAFASTPFAEVGAPVSLTTASPVAGATGTERVKASPVVLNQYLVVGDRAGNVIQYDYNTGVKQVNQVNYGYPIETPIAVDLDDDLNVIDLFVCAGGQLEWVKPDGTVYMGQYALVEKGANNASVNAANFTTFVNMTTPTALTASTDFQAFSTASSTSTDALALPSTTNTPTSLDYNRLTHCGFLTGLPPTLSAWAGKLNTKFYNYYPWNTGSNPVALSNTPPGSGTAMVSYPVQDGEAIAGANLLSPSAIDFDDDGSSFVADTNHCQVLFNPASATAWQRWYPAAAMSTAAFNWRAGAKPDGNTTVTYASTPANSPAQNNFYVFAGTLYPNAPNADADWSGKDSSDGNGAGKLRDVGNGSQPSGTAGGSVYTQPAQCPANGTTGGTIARGSAINRAQGVAVGNLGLYVANRNAFQSGTYKDGQILFMPRVGLPSGTYWGISNPQPGRMYVICNFVDPQGIDVYRDPSNATRDVVFAPCMASSSPNARKIFKLDSATVNSATVPGTAGVTLTTLPSGANPYDVGLDDNGNLFIADLGASTLRMIAKVMPKSAGAPTRNWGTAGVANTLYSVKTGMADIASVSFAANDPQVPSGQGCLYLGLGASPATTPNRIIRLDETLYHQAVAGAAYGYINTAVTVTTALGDAGDGGAGNASGVQFAMPWRARGRYNSVNGTYETYICDRGNNRIRRIVSAAGSSTAVGYMCFPFPTAALGKPIYSADLTLYSRTAAGTLGVPDIGFASPYLKNGAVWTHTSVAASPASFTPTRAPAVDLAINKAAPVFPSTSTSWNFAVSPGGTTAPYYKWRLPAQAIQTSSSNTALQHLRLGLMQPQDDPLDYSYFYPTSTGVITAPNQKSPEFYTNRNGGTATTYPKVDYKYGNLAMTYPILSPPAIYYAPGGERYVYLCNANALWRYNVTSPDTFITAANGAEVVFTKSAQGRDPLKGTVYLAGTFQFNSAPPLIDWNGKVAMLDIWGVSGVSYSYSLSAFNGNLAGSATDMWTNSSVQVSSSILSSPTDNSGIYIISDPYMQYMYFGLANGRIFKLALN